MGNFRNCRMATNHNLEFAGLATSLADLVVEKRFDELDEALDNLRVVVTDEYNHGTEREIRILVKTLIQTKSHHALNNYMPRIIKALVEAEDYNALIMIDESAKVYGELPKEAKALIDKYIDYRAKAIESFTQWTASGRKDDLPKVEGLDVFYERRSLFFKPKHSAVAYRVFRFDS